MAENPATWGRAEKIVNQALDRADEGHAAGMVGWSTPRQVTEALRQAGLLREYPETVPNVCHLYDDGGPQVDAVEEPDEGPGQAILVRVGPVFDGGIQRKEPGIWIEYQEYYSKCLPAGPVLLTPEVWMQLVRAVNRRLQRRQPLWRRLLP